MGKERAILESIVHTIEQLESEVQESEELLILAEEEKDEELYRAANKDLTLIQERIELLEFRRMFSGEMDSSNAYLEIQAGSGGTEAQDWAEMILRMYLRWGEGKGFKAQLVEVSGGDVAGIKSATVQFSGDFAFGWLRTETGVHRLVRKSPFDSGNRRHTSFVSVFVSPEISDDIEVDLNMADVRIDTYRASGAGGQHVNKTDSAIRITHLPTNIVVQCQNERSQLKNKNTALKMLKSKLYQLEIEKKREEKEKLEGSKKDISWGSQIRSYIFHPYNLVKDHRTNKENNNVNFVMDGGIDLFIREFLLKKNESKS